MGFIYAILKRSLKFIIYLTLVLTFIVLIPNLPPYTKFSSIPLAPEQERTGALATNDALNNIQKLYEGKILGPEAFQIWKNELYTSLATGEIVKLSPGGHVTFVTKIGKPCTGLIQEHICGRPLGFYIHEKSGTLYVADAYHGIWKVDLKTDRKQQLVSPNVPIDGRKPQLFNSITLDKNGGVYWTDSSSDYMLKDGVYIGLSDPSGRLFYYNPATKENKVLLDNLWFPNGVALSPDESFVLVVETLKQRLLKYYISGPKKGKSEVFVDGLPGTPDNIRALPDNSGIQIALYSASDENNPIITRNLASLPTLRKLLARLSRLIEIPFEYLNSQFPNPVFEEIVYQIGHIATATPVAPDLTALLISDWNGNIIASFYNTDSNVKHISDAIVFNDKLMLGSPHKQNFVAAVPIPELLKKTYFANELKTEVPKVKDTPVQKPTVPKEIPKHSTTTTTTQKPTTASTSTTTTTTPKPPTTSTTTTTQKPPTTSTTTTTQKPPTTSTTTTTQKPPTTSTTTTTQKPPTTSTTEKPITTTQKPSTKPMPQQKVTPTQKEPEVKQKKTDNIEKPMKSETPPQKQPENKVKESQPNTAKKETGKSSTEKQNSPPVSKPTESKADSGKVNKSDNKPKAENTNKKQDENIPKKEKPVPSTIPIVEEIVSDTAKPNKDKLKVIKKSGPEEIPNPHI
ncbi:probable serine/threonine-protein kinase nek3 [Zerene cesonia]|uniref:probable serine/threonine-protein kinase nek3 n=1 Tax=Zerene cesonia TaxID=33412 RepID=UPI0018E5787F|nr:probable serine/threonine-protein kinase nek3 [Zerene cesonia]